MSGLKDAFLGDTPLLDWRPPYPRSPGFRDPTTSREAALKMTSRAETLRGQVLDLLADPKHRAGVTVHEAASILDVTVPAVQPRFSELVKLGKIKRAQERRRNESGMSAAVWVLA